MAGSPKKRARQQAEAEQEQLRADAKRMGISPARLAAQRANGAKGAAAQRFENREPELAAEIIAGTTAIHPMLEPVKDAAERLGLNPTMISQLLERVRTDYLPLHDALDHVQTDTMERLFGNAAETILRSITFEDIEKAGLRDKMVAAAIALDKRNLLKGLPTERISIEDRETLRELLPLIRREAERREITVDVTPGANAAVEMTTGIQDSIGRADMARGIAAATREDQRS